MVSLLQKKRGLKLAYLRSKLLHGGYAITVKIDLEARVLAGKDVSQFSFLSSL